ncbi:MAG: glycoside hydrolase family 3 C-terminal domain-containing protein, partial [Cohnella sp.]|nr:glycoside hydrolase family 3 C-terminal domain-containing protein [Cohnella sp.]
LKKNLKIALIGPNSDTVTNFFGGYSSVGSANTRSSDFDKSEEDSFLRMIYTGVITDNKESLKSAGIEFEDEPTPEQREIIMNMIRENMAADASSKRVYKTGEQFVGMFYPDCKSVKDVLEERLGKDAVLHAKGCNISKAIDGGIEAVREAVRQADIVVAVLGGKESMIDPEATCGENKDNHNIGLQQSQLDMMDEVFKLHKPVISIIIDGRPLATPTVSERSKAVLYAWLPAQSGAFAIANIVTGKTNPSGKLPTTILKGAGQIPMYNGRLPLFADINEWSGYIDNNQNRPLYPFGHGLSYTRFEYLDLVHDDTIQPDGELNIEFKLRNAGQVSGDEVVQVYIRDRVGSVARPVKQLVGFARVSLDVNETKKVAFKINMKQLAFHDLNMDQVVEPGMM